jgi:protein-tyrosine phosphatase
MDVRPHDGYDEIVAAVRAGREHGVVYVHCWGGIGRTSTVAGCLLVDGGLDADAALADIDRRRSVTRKADMAAPQTQRQINVIHARAARRRAD